MGAFGFGVKEVFQLADRQVFLNTEELVVQFRLAAQKLGLAACTSQLNAVGCTVACRYYTVCGLYVAFVGDRVNKPDSGYVFRCP